MSEEDRYGGGLGRYYKSYEQAEIDFRRYQNHGIIDFLNQTVSSDDGVDWCVVTEGFNVGVYQHRSAAFMIGLHWECGEIATFTSRAAAYTYFGDMLQSGRVRRKELRIVWNPETRLQRREYTWSVEKSD
ncbi:hypothetical protein V5O48_017234 [Marasmius crinis-equi]|uniref:Uncharacterized protein n=1 Tax=Marasmius crinis-equi TaxID=585013 RepID=A0ABR3EPJ4_9AGAR